MSASLDKSLDEIIAAKSSARKNSFKNKKSGKFSKVSKARDSKTSKPRPNVKKTSSTAAAFNATANKVIDASSATKAVIYGLPKDIKQDAIKEFFQSSVGGIHTVALSYNEKGQSKGIATIIFKNSASAQKAVKLYNGAPIDGGKNNLKIELILDPTKKPLAARIQANQPENKKVVQKKKDNLKNRIGGGAPNKKNAPKKNTGKKQPNKPKTSAELDQEMSDYFEKKD